MDQFNPAQPHANLLLRRLFMLGFHSFVDSCHLLQEVLD